MHKICYTILLYTLLLFGLAANELLKERQKVVYHPHDQRKLAELMDALVLPPVPEAGGK